MHFDMGDSGGGILTLWVALIAVAGVVFSAAISWAISQRTIYINAVTAERTKWIGSLRGNISQLVGLLGTHHAELANNPHYETPVRVRQTANALSALITLQLNPHGFIDRNMITILGFVPYLLSGARPIFVINLSERLLVGHAQWLLKNEWERVKAESSILARWRYSRLMKKREADYETFSRFNDVNILNTLTRVDTGNPSSKLTPDEMRQVEEANDLAMTESPQTEP